MDVTSASGRHITAIPLHAPAAPHHSPGSRTSTTSSMTQRSLIEREKLHGALRYLDGVFEAGGSDLDDLVGDHCGQRIVTIHQTKSVQGQFVSRDEVAGLGKQGVLQPIINRHRSVSDKETAPAIAQGDRQLPGPSVWAGGGPAMVAS